MTARNKKQRKAEMRTRRDCQSTVPRDEMDQKKTEDQEK